MDKEFPIFKNHQSVICWNCETPLHGCLSDVQESGYPDGKFVQYCPACEMRTFYDVKEN
jgi:RNase P subunit RPR2